MPNINNSSEDTSVHDIDKVTSQLETLLHISDSANRQSVDIPTSQLGYLAISWMGTKEMIELLRAESVTLPRENLQLRENAVVSEREVLELREDVLVMRKNCCTGTFVLFTKLPYELRCLVWKFSIDLTRIIVVEYDAVHKEAIRIKRGGRNYPELHVCSEA